MHSNVSKFHIEFDTLAKMIVFNMIIAVADLRGGAGDARPLPPWGSKFFQFHAVFGKFRQNRMLAPLPGSWHPLLGEILDPPLNSSNNLI